jgi:hypothetical protein
MEIDAFACMTRIPPLPSELRLAWHQFPSRGLKLKQVMGEQNRNIHRRMWSLVAQPYWRLMARLALIPWTLVAHTNKQSIKYCFN